MQSTNLKELLEAYNPSSNQEICYKKQMLDFLATCSDCFERSCALGHFTASSWLLNQAMNKCLLLHHVKLDRWLQLGGHADGDPDLLSVAQKETREESGLTQIYALTPAIFDVDIHLIPPKKEQAHYHFDVRFLLQAVGNEEIVVNSEAKAVRWFDLNPESLPTSEPSIMRMLQKSLAWSGSLSEYARL